MEAKKTKKATIENRRGSWLLMGVVVALSFMFVSFEWTQHGVNSSTSWSAHDPIFEIELVPVTYSEKKLEPPPLPESKPAEWIEIVKNDLDVDETVVAGSEDEGLASPVVWVPPVVEEKKVEEDVIFVTAQEMPEFPGGSAALLKYLSTHIKYPTPSQEVGSQGKVIVQFVVDKDGSIINLEVLRGVDPYLDKEALRVLRSMPKWKAGMQNGKKVRVKYTVPVVFRLQ